MKRLVICASSSKTRKFNLAVKSIRGIETLAISRTSSKLLMNTTGSLISKSMTGERNILPSRRKPARLTSYLLM